MSTTVSIHLSATLDAELRKGAKNPSHLKGKFQGFHQLLATHALKPTPLFPSHDASAEFIWHVECPNHQAAEVVDMLLATPGVEAAYAKPAEGLPGPP